MTNTMTPSERADWLEGLARILRAEAQHSAAVNARWREHRWEPSEGLAKGCEQAAATIRELEAGRARWEADDGLDGSVVHAVREVLNRANVPTMAFIDDHVALLVRQRDAAEAKLKIATEALESAKFTLSGSGQIPDEVMAQNAVLVFRTIAAALARIDGNHQPASVANPS